MFYTACEREAAVWTEEDEEEIEYGKLYSYTAKDTLAEEYKIHSPRGDIWPHWSDGVPIKLSRQLGSPPFSLGKVSHRYRSYYATVELDWSGVYTLSELRRSSSKRLLPYHSGGVYRLFAPDTCIDSSCGKDPTGTLYLGCAGTKRNWSNLRTRIKSLVSGDHHAISNAHYNKAIKKTFARRSLAVQWAYTGERTSYKGEAEPAALLAEAWLLACYNDSFGEYPPWNQKG
jgi:hypothetical protein